MKLHIEPPFTRASALAVVRAAETAWNARDPRRLALACSVDSAWRDRDELLHGRVAIQEFLARRWQEQRDCRELHELWAFAGARISVRVEAEFRRAESGLWYRVHRNEHLEFDRGGLIRTRDASADEIPILERDRSLRP